MKLKLLGLFLIAVGFSVGCGGEDINKGFKPTTKDTPRPTAAGMGTNTSGPAASAPTPP